MKRRQLLKALGFSSAGIVALSCSDQERAAEIAAAQGALQDADLDWGKAPCRFCGTGCGVEVGVKDGRVMAVRGDTASPVNKGLLCVKGYHLPGFLYGEDRLEYPMLRDGEDWRRISWEEALDLIAEKFQEALDTHGPESVAMYGSGQWTIFDGYAATKWYRGGMQDWVSAGLTTVKP
jgi:nitrate reductase NapA